MTAASVPLTCRELVELVTGYLEGTLAADDMERFERHLAGCDPCVEYVEQIRLTVAAAGHVTEEGLDPEFREELRHTFRTLEGR
jgi:anti-sigma factor RsiW